MPLLPILLILLVPIFLAVALPFSLLQRYRSGIARRRVRGWVAFVNLALLVLSGAIFLWVAALTNLWVPHAFSYALLGLGAGGVLGLIGLVVTRWESSSGALHYTPNRALILLLTFAVALRLVYGLWRAWHAWGTHPAETSWLAAAGVANSMAVGAVVLGYYLVYFMGVIRRLAVHRRRA